MNTHYDIHAWFQPLWDAALLLQGPPPHLCCFTGVLSLRCPAHTKEPHKILYHFNRRCLRDGPTSKQWESIYNRIHHHLQENPQCTLAQKPYQISKSTDYSAIVTAPGTELSSHYSWIQASAFLN